MVPLENNAKRLSSVNDTTKTIRHYYHHELLLPILPYNFFYFIPFLRRHAHADILKLIFFLNFPSFSLPTYLE